MAEAGPTERELRERYQSSSDRELIELASEAAGLVPLAREVLAAELARRGIRHLTSARHNLAAALSEAVKGNGH